MPGLSLLAPVLVALAAPAEGRGGIEGTIVDERRYWPLEGVTLTLDCDCADEPRSIETRAGGAFRFDDLLPGRYRLEILGGATPISHTYEVTAGPARKIVVGVSRGEAPTHDARKFLVYPGYSRHRGLRRAQIELGAGGVLVAAGALLLTGGILEAAKPSCEMGSDGCDDPPRSRLARGLLVGGALSLGAGAALLGLGGAHLRRHRLGAHASTHAVGLSWSGTF